MRDLNPWAKNSVGRELHRARYAAYIQSAEWFRRRDIWAVEELRRREGELISCLGCYSPWLVRRDDMHHASYDRLGNEAHEDLWPLCRTCHTNLHDVLDSTKSWKKLSRLVANTHALTIVQRDRGVLSPVSSVQSLRDYL